VRVVRGDGGGFIAAGRPGEGYRLEAVVDERGVFTCSYHFALAEEDATTWRLAVEETPEEPIGRVVENAARYLVARQAVEGGGLALHGAGVLRHGRAWVFAGKSGSGKSTAVSLSAPGVSLGDDFAVVIPSADGWRVAAVPFDNAERAPATPPGPPFLAGVFRLHHAGSPRLGWPSAPQGQASLIACVAFPWALPDLAEKIQDAVGALVSAGLFGELWFAPDPSFWVLLEKGV